MAFEGGRGPHPAIPGLCVRRLNVSPELFLDYARARDTTRREHLLELQRDFGFQPFTDALSSKLADHLLPNALRSPKPISALESVLGWDQFANRVEEAERLVEPFDCDFLDEMHHQYPQIRQYSPTLLNTFLFRVAQPSASLLKAIELLREVNESGKRKVPKSAPRSFVRQRWAPHVFSGGTFLHFYFALTQ